MSEVVTLRGKVKLLTLRVALRVCCNSCVEVDYFKVKGISIAMKFCFLKLQFV